MHRPDSNQQIKKFLKFYRYRIGLSDFYKVTVTAVKSFFKKPKLEKLTYLDFKSSDKWINLTQSFR